MQMLKCILVSNLFSTHLFTTSSNAQNIINLAPGPNRELVMQNCLGCHSERLILQNRMSRKAWDEKITWMQNTQNLWPLNKEIRSKILDYLEKTQSPLQSLEFQDSMDGLGGRRTNPLLVEEKRGG